MSLRPRNTEGTVRIERMLNGGRKLPMLRGVTAKVSLND